MLSGYHNGTTCGDCFRGLKIVAKGQCFGDNFLCNMVTNMVTVMPLWCRNIYS
jgi:hypothetical protein